MTPFTFHRPASLQEALRLLAAGQDKASSTKLMAGGQSLLLALKERALRPAHVLSLASLHELTGIRTSSDGRLDIGAATTYADLSRAHLSGWHAEIAAVAGNLADRSVRNLGTIGGGACQAEPRFDMPVVLMAADAHLQLASVQGPRTLAAGEFFNRAGGTHMNATEILTRIWLPPVSWLDALAFEKFRFRAFEAAVASVACALKLSAGGRIGRVRLIVGAVARAPLSAAATASALEGSRAADVSAGDIGARVAAEVVPLAEAQSQRQRYQSELVVSLAARAYARAVAQSTGN